MITTFFRDYHGTAAPETRQDLYRYRPLFLPLVPSAVVCLAISSLERGYWRIRYKMNEVVWTKVLADLIGNFCLHLKVNVRSLHIVTATQYFISDSSHVH